ncbi:hypothetical protein QM996_09145 [Sinorhizobium chiapasense]
MPRTGGVYSPPAGTKGVPNTTIQSVPYNTLIDDLTADANAPRPLTAGGTGATSASGARMALGLEIGTNVQAQDAGLQSIAGLTTTPNQMLYTTGTDLYSTTALTPFARTILDDVDAVSVKTTLGLATVASSGSASDLTSGTLADARLPGAMSGKTFNGSVVVSSAASAALILNGPSTNGIEVGRTDGTATNTYIDFHSSGNNIDFDARILASGGNGSIGQGGLTVTAQGGGLTLAGTSLSGTSAYFSSTLTAQDVLSNGSIQIRNSGNRVFWLMNASGINRTAVFHDDGSEYVGINLYNTSGSFVRALQIWQAGELTWNGTNFVIEGNGSTSCQLRMNVDTDSQYRFIGTNSNELYIQRSSNNFGSATTLLRWDNSNDALFSRDIYANRVVSSSSGLGTNFAVGDDIWIGDVNVANHMKISGRQDGTKGFVRFGNSANALGVDGTTSVDRLIWGSWLLQSDGNQYLPYIGKWMNVAFEEKATVYTGSNQDETNLPVGHSVLCYSNGVRNRNQGYATYLSTAAYQYTLDVGASSQLGGTWRARGQITYSSGNSMVQMQRTA